jgi:hypothetical protein
VAGATIAAPVSVVNRAGNLQRTPQQDRRDRWRIAQAALSHRSQNALTAAGARGEAASSGWGRAMAADNQPGKETEKGARYGAIFAALRQLLTPYENALAVKIDKPGNCYLETQSASLNGRRLFFASAKIKKHYVSFYLTPLYMFPDLSHRVSPMLKKLMQGQSCFNFTAIDQACLDELGQLTQAGFLKFKSQALL